MGDFIRFRNKSVGDYDKLCVFGNIQRRLEDGSVRLENVTFNRIKHDINKLTSLASMLKQEDECFRALVDNCDDMSDRDFYKQIIEFYKINIPYLLDVFHKSMFDHPVEREIKTNGVIKINQKYKMGSGYAMIPMWYRNACRVITDENFPIEKKIYSVEEVARLSNQDKIVIRSSVNPYGDSINTQVAYSMIKKMKQHPFKRHTLHEGFDKDKSLLTDEELDQMYTQNSKVFARIRQELPKQQIELDYANYTLALNKLKEDILNRLITLGVSSDECSQLFDDHESVI